MYCLRHTKGSKDLKCRFNYPIDCSDKTELTVEQMYTKDSSVHFKAKFITKRNDERLNNHQRIQLQGWRANCDIQVILDHHACVEYLSKYAAKGESRSFSLDDAFNKVINSVNSDVDSAKAVKKIMIKTLGERDIGAQETMHLLLSLKLYMSSFNVIPVNLNPSRRVDTKFKVVNQKLENHVRNIVPRFFPIYSSNPRDRAKYSEQQIAEMPKWIDTKKNENSVHLRHYIPIDTTSFSQEQRLAHNITVHHSTLKSKEALLLIVTGLAGTGKSYLINAVRNYLGEKCAVTATTGKASYAIYGVTIHLLLRLPIACSSHKDLSGQCLLYLQNNLADIDYIIIDEYSMLGQITLGWIDRRCLQITGLKEEIFGGKSIILIGDPGQLPPVGDKPLYHSKPSGDIGQQGYLAYLLFTNVVALRVNQRVNGENSEQTSFCDLLGRLRIGESNISDWKWLLDRQPSSVTNIDEFEDAVRLYYSNKQGAEYNYNKLKQLNQPIAIINACHSGNQAKHISLQQLFGLQPCLYISKGAKVMLTLNLWPSLGLCNGSTGTVVDIIYAVNHQPPDLPIAVIVHFDNYIGPAFGNIASCVPIVPFTASNISNGTINERQQIPLTLAWALTIHKSQGMTLKKAWVDIGQKESALGISYVAISRVPNISSLVIEPTSFNRLSAIKESQTLKFRIMEEKRLNEIAEKNDKYNHHESACKNPMPNVNLHEGDKNHETKECKQKLGVHLDEEEIFINKRSKLDKPCEDEIDFDIQLPSKPSECEMSCGVTNIKDILDTVNSTLVNVTGRITFQSFEETILKNGKTLWKQEAIFTDSTASVRLVLWEQDIDKVVSASFYKLSRTVVREYEGDKYLTLNKKSTIEETTASTERQDEVGV
ncbi:ATP-dependent DNA helicase PIF1 [Paramuricea clavata]|uniref:ATP-dependent DNA helicase n=1 Tax=Paramuricea clavata TaxID=317549 RepID=A0A6S7JG41_PARCT|nr:ATP-dependent DNA helicase PIF1 [Paramuricea clavata]